MSDGASDAYRLEQIEKAKKKQELMCKVAKIIDDYKFPIAEELVNLMEDME